MSKIREAFTTPAGRLVQGDPFVPQTKDRSGNLRVVKSGPNAGQPSPQTFIAVAFPKTAPDPATGVTVEGRNPAFEAFYGVLDRVARQEWPQFFPAGAQKATHPRFAWKVKDGDGVDENGKSNADKEGFAGHWVVSFASAYSPKVVRPAGNGVWETVTDPAALKRGYYVRVAGSATGNDSTDTPGLYVNLDMVEIVGYGPEIVSGPDAASVFGQPAALPPGASPTPIAGPGPAAPAPGGPGGPLAAAVAPAAPASPAAASSVAASPAAPNAAFMAPPPPGGGAIPAPTMTAAANGLTREQYHASGWTDDQLIAQGLMIA
jgi:hypothetical protein